MTSRPALSASGTGAGKVTGMVPSDPSRDQPPAPVSPPAPGSPSAPASLPKRRLSPGRRLLRLMLRLVALLLLAVAVSLGLHLQHTWPCDTCR